LTESYPEVKEGTLDTDAVVTDFIADEAIDLWSPVILVAAGTGEDMPRVEPINTAHNVLVMGVAVSPLVDSTNNYCASAAGGHVGVCVFGRCKVKVDGNAGNIAIGDALVTHAADGVAQLMAIAADVTNNATLTTTLARLGSKFAIALKASTADGDIIPCFVNSPTSGTQA
jgi:acyl CoA:acetate/3-ketoacid CoA transferase beta subunit